MNQGLKILCLLLLVISHDSYAKGIIGSYEITGIMYDGKSPLINQKITVRFGENFYSLNTDSLGHYLLSIPYTTACPSAVRGFKRITANKTLNPKFIFLDYNAKSKKIRNKWNKYSRKSKVYIELKFV